MAVTFIRAVIIYVLVIVAMRIMGKRQIGELKPHEFVITILISAIAAVPLEDNSMPLANSVIPIFTFAALEIIVSVISMKSFKFRDILQGKPVFIIRNGRLDQNALRRMRFTMDDLVDALRQNSIFNIEEVQDAVVETNGSVSVLPKAEYKPVTPKDLELNVTEATTPVTVVMDGRIVTDYFSNFSISETEIELLLTGQKLEAESVMLLTVDDGGKSFYIEKEKV